MRTLRAAKRFEGTPPENLAAAARLDEVARLLEDQGANTFRVRAYRRAAHLLRSLPRSIVDIVRESGPEGLEALPGVGVALARSIHQMATTGRLPMLDRLRGEANAEEILASVPGVGEVTARRLHDLGIETLEELEIAAYDGRLTNRARIGSKRLAGIRDSLAQRLGRIRRERSSAGREEPAGVLAAGALDPPIAEVLDVDREYRERARAGTLQCIAPRRFNPKHVAWLPILHTHRGTRHYTVLFSNTARAHELAKTGDWVVLYCEGAGRERQHTVITSTRGPLAGRRIVRGREEECAAYYGSPIANAIGRS